MGRLRSCYCGRCRNCRNLFSERQRYASMSKRQRKAIQSRRDPESVKRSSNRVYQRRVAILSWAKSRGCCFCGEHDDCVLDFHHVVKGKPVSNRVSIVSLRQELNKCILVCANCHRRIHAGLLDDSKKPTIQLPPTPSSNPLIERSEESTIFWSMIEEKMAKTLTPAA